jgi:hypothetical protein
VDLHVFSRCEHTVGHLRCCGFDTISIVGAAGSGPIRSAVPEQSDQ